jgi:hypothetical protein
MTISNPGRIGLVKIHGAAGLGIRFGQYLNGSGFEDFEHAFMDLGDATVIEAEPGGARIRPLAEYDDATVHWCDNIYGGLSLAQRLAIADAGRKYEHVPYSFLDYDALAAHRFGLDTKFLRDYISSTGHMICSQLVDRAYNEGGYHIFTDGRWDGFVTPGDLYLEDTVTKPWVTTSFYARRDL